MEGLLLVDKPSGPTSQDVVTQVRRLLGGKVGHTGTLDPLATGLLPLLLGSATRLSRFFLSCDKEYRAEIRLGETRNTFDGEGTLMEKTSVPEISSQKVEEVLEKFRGEILQKPPMFSAVKIKGERLYRLARRNLQVDRPHRQVNISLLSLLNRTDRTWSIQVRCSSGTYIRSIAHDIGQELGCGAYLEGLQRTSVGNFSLSQSVPLKTVEQDWSKAFYPIEELLPELPIVEMDPEEKRRVCHGNEMSSRLEISAEHCRLFHQGALVAIGLPTPQGFIRPIIVLTPEH